MPPQGGRKHPNQDFLQIDTTNILFICGGAFDGLEKVIQQPHRSARASASAPRCTARTSARVIRRLPRGRAGRPDQVRPDPRAGRPPAGGRDARRADRGRAGPDPHRAEERAGQAVPEAVRRWKASSSRSARRRSRAIARKALARKTGARGLRSIMEQSLIDTMFELPTLDGVAKVVVDEHTIEEDAKPLLVYREQQGQGLRLRRHIPRAPGLRPRRFLQLTPRTQIGPRKRGTANVRTSDPARRTDHAAAAAAARCGGLSAHGDPAVRRPAQVDQGARSGDGGGPPDHARGAEGRGQGRAQARRHVRGRLRLEHPADAEAARWHREGARRRHPAREHEAASATMASTSSPTSTPVPPEPRPSPRSRRCAAR